MLSIIVPIYNVESYLTQCIESLISQTYQNIEIILVNDGSTDNSGEICESFRKKDSRIVVVHQENNGLVSARKAGITISKGDYIGYVDGDDWVEPNMYEDLMNLAKKHNVDVVVGGHKEELDGKVVEILSNNLPCGLYSKDKLITEVYPRMLCTGVFSQFGIFSYLWNKIFKKEILYPNQMAVSNEIFMAEDAACTYPALLDSGSIYITDSNFYRYRQRVDSMVKSRDIDKSELKRYNILYRHLYFKFFNSKFSEILIPQLNLFLLSLLTVRSSLNFENSEDINELFAFKKIKKRSKIIICGAGTFGQHLARRVKQNQNFTLIAWVDELSKIYKDMGLQISSLEDIFKLEYDYILIAYIDEKNAGEIKNKLFKFGVKPEKTLVVSHYLEYPINELLSRFGISLENAN